MKKLIVTSTDDKFAPGCAVLLHSLKKNMSIFNECDVKVFYTSLGEQSKQIIRRVCPKADFEMPKDFDYCKGIKTLYGEDNQDTYLCLESFKQSEYDRVAYIDTDMLCIGDMSDIFSENLDYDMMACIGSKPLNIKQSFYRNGISKFNAGFMVIGKKHLDGRKTYNDLIDIVERAKSKKNNNQYRIMHKTAPTFNDQDAIKIYWQNRGVFILPDWYNFKNFGAGPRPEDFKRTDDLFRQHLDNIKLIHYSGKRKPWANSTDRSGPSIDGKIPGMYDVCSVADPVEMNRSLAMHMWHDYYEECFGKKCINDWYKHDKEMRW
jgi:lipopolysaccharide biosynthesis glycosyltransferase